MTDNNPQDTLESHTDAIQAQLFFRTDKELREIANAGAEITRQHQQATFLAEFNDTEKPVLSEAEETTLLTGQLAHRLYQDRRVERDAHGQDPNVDFSMQASIG